MGKYTTNYYTLKQHNKTCSPVQTGRITVDEALGY